MIPVAVPVCDAGFLALIVVVDLLLEKLSSVKPTRGAVFTEPGEGREPQRSKGDHDKAALL